MNRSVVRLLYWAPRVLGIGFAVFISLFALDVFGEGYTFRQTVVALTMHLIPTAIVVVGLLLAWRWEWVGAVVFAGAGILYMISAWNHPDWILLISGPLFVVGALFLVNWVKRAELRART